MKLINNIFPLNICSVVHLFLFCYIINIISTQNIVNNEEKYPTFKSFLSKFHKTYNLKAEYEKREQIYLHNIQQIKQSNCESCGVNFYADWTEQEIKSNIFIKLRSEKCKIIRTQIKYSCHSKDEFKIIDPRPSTFFRLENCDRIFRSERFRILWSKLCIFYSGVFWTASHFVWEWKFINKLFRNVLNDMQFVKSGL